MRARAEYPPGPLAQEGLLVAYNRVAGDNMAGLDVTMADGPDSEDLAEVLKNRETGGGWKADGPVETFELGGHSAARGACKNRSAAPADLKEVVAVRNGSRVYFFTGLFSANDAKSREQVRKSIDTLTW